MYVCIYNIQCKCVCIYIHIYRERERGRERDAYVSTHLRYPMLIYKHQNKQVLFKSPCKSFKPPLKPHPNEFS